MGVPWNQLFFHRIFHSIQLLIPHLWKVPFINGVTPLNGGLIIGVFNHLRFVEWSSKQLGNGNDPPGSVIFGYLGYPKYRIFSHWPGSRSVNHPFLGYPNCDQYCSLPKKWQRQHVAFLFGQVEVSWWEAICVEVWNRWKTASKTQNTERKQKRSASFHARGIYIYVYIYIGMFLSIRAFRPVAFIALLYFEWSPP